MSCLPRLLDQIVLWNIPTLRGLLRNGKVNVKAGVLHNGARKQAMILFGKEEKERSGVGSADR